MATTKKARRTARQLFQLCCPTGTLDPARVREVARRLSSATDRASLAVFTEFQRRVRLDRAQHTALIESAVGLSDDVRRELEASLTRLHGTDLEMVFSLNPALLGGMRITVGSNVYDGSVRHRLAAIEERL